ncbi:MAG: bifunctional metallophosphatase/5'-nucleotidase [Paracoccaceae bacterium]|nr:bifunctional metallophosphatase/5'-nucleotidase [Paracoccaceae bacterium]
MSGSLVSAEYSLTILHTNDFHARFQPISKYDNNCSEKNNLKGKCFGGSARLIEAIKNERTKFTNQFVNTNSILVDGGDQFMGTLFYTYYKGKVTAEMMNRLGYDAMTVGNHEFDDGPEVLRGFMDAVSFPVLMSNADFSKEPVLANKLIKSTVIHKAYQGIGLIGLTPQDTDEIANPGPNITFSDPSEAVQREVDRLTKLGINKIIVLSHSGYEVDKIVAANTTGVDVIVGGHSNTYLSNTSDRAKGPYPTVVNNTQIVQAYAYGKFLGALDVIFDDAGNVITATGEPIIMDSNIAENEAIKARLIELEVPLNKLKEKVVASNSTNLNGERDNCRVRECTMGNLIADAMRDAVSDKGYNIALQNSGGIRASIDLGEVTMGEVLTVLPFQNTLATFKVTGEQLLAALENGVSQVEDVKGRFPQVSGLRFSFDIAIAPGEGRVQSVEVDQNGSWAPLDIKATYGVVSNNFIRGGGDGYKMFRQATDVYDFGPDVADIVADFLAKNPNYQTSVEGRINQM